MKITENPRGVNRMETRVARLRPPAAAPRAAILLEQNDAWAVQHASYMTLESAAAVSDDPVVSLAHVEG